MGDIPNVNPPVPLAPQKWIAKIILAVIVGEAVWGLLVSLTNGLIVPGLARVMGGDPQSPVYLGKGDFNLTGIFVSILELCLAGIVAILLNQWSRTGAGMRVKTIKVRTVAAQTTPSGITASSITPTGSAPKSEPPAPRPPVLAAKPTAPPKPEKPKEPAEVYYNIVGEPINPTEDDG